MMENKIANAILVICWILTCSFVGSSQANFSSFNHGDSWSGKPALDTGMLGKWPYLHSPRISSDGRFVCYSVINEPYETEKVVVKDTKSTWHKSIYGLSAGHFSRNGKFFYYQMSDTIFIVKLGTDETEYYTDVQSFRMPLGSESDFFSYRDKKNPSDLHVVNLNGNFEKVYRDVDIFSFDRKGESIVMFSGRSFRWLELKTFRPVRYGDQQEGAVVNGSIVFNSAGDRLVYLVKSKNNDKQVTSLWTIDRTSGDIPRRLLSDDSLREMHRQYITSRVEFSKNDKFIFIGLMRIKEKVVKTNRAVTMVDIWKYNDVLLHPEQQRKAGLIPGSVNNDIDTSLTNTVAVSISTGKLVAVESDTERLITAANEVTGNHVVVWNNLYIRDEWWPAPEGSAARIIDLNDGSRRMIKKGNESLYYFSFSPSGRFLIYWDIAVKSFISYDVVKGISHRLQDIIPENITQTDIDQVYPLPFSTKPVSWLRNDKGVLIYDKFDIWLVDPAGKTVSVNLTNGYGRRNKIQMRMLYESPGPAGVQPEEGLLLSGYSDLTKDNGFFKLSPKPGQDPVKLNMGSYAVSRKESQIGFARGEDLEPVKAAGANCWLVERQSVRDLPNYFVTTDFRTFSAVSNLCPQKNFNWVSAELISWMQPDGHINQGVLYKPDNFDSTKIYPLIFTYYEQSSFKLHQFRYPDFTQGNINIPWFVSNGYLVCEPDIHYSIAAESGIVVGEHAYNSVISAADFLSRRKYVDPARMAVVGHSFGAYQTNYIITHSKRFAAAVEAAGVTDPVSAYLTLAPMASPVEHHSAQASTEFQHALFGAPLWQSKNFFLKQSAVLNADNIATPLLIMHNKRDNQIQWRQGVELYMALRRLNKKCWMLQYDNGTHAVFGKDAVDYTIRLTQFLDYYLKGVYPPVWMTKGVPATQKGEVNGYEYDPAGTP